RIVVFASTLLGVAVLLAPGHAEARSREAYQWSHAKSSRVSYAWHHAGRSYAYHPRRSYTHSASRTRYSHKAPRKSYSHISVTAQSGIGGGGRGRGTAKEQP